MKNIVSFQPPKFEPLPGELTPAIINGATLPVKIGIAQRAIAACCDLSELLTWKDKLAALAAAAKMARMPEMARDVNRIHKEAIFRMGEILLQYKGVSLAHKSNGKLLGRVKSERAVVGLKAGISLSAITNSTRLAQAPIAVRQSILDDSRLTPNPVRMAARAPTRRKSQTSYYTDAARLVFNGQESISGSRSMGLNSAAVSLRSVRFDAIAGMVVEEKQRARKLVVEMQEILDEIDRRLGPA